jgi:hypothetical protein
MLSFASDFWPVFWTIFGGAVLLTVLLSLLVATFSPAWFRPRQRHQPTLATAEPTAERPAGPRAGRDYQPDRAAKAA